MYLLAYGSLVADLPERARPGHSGEPSAAEWKPGRDPYVRRVRGFRRQWGVAMDNRVDLPGYKFYVRSSTDERHEGHVAFLDLVEDPDAAFDGALFEVSESDLVALDARERNYSRADITTNVIDPPGPVIAYAGTAA